mmetsp:Transcript_29253/g.57424  ORF Transcript_29253/g.57424 Transcript_29253/m.57424 type:complete len:226 (+) Transcript_29253:719-1396(+)
MVCRKNNLESTYCNHPCMHPSGQLSQSKRVRLLQQDLIHVPRKTLKSVTHTSTHEMRKEGAGKRKKRPRRFIPKSDHFFLLCPPDCCLREGHNAARQTSFEPPPSPSPSRDTKKVYVRTIPALAPRKRKEKGRLPPCSVTPLSCSCHPRPDGCEGRQPRQRNMHTWKIKTEKKGSATLLYMQREAGSNDLLSNVTTHSAPSFRVTVKTDRQAARRRNLYEKRRLI